MQYITIEQRSFNGSRSRENDYFNHPQDAGYQWPDRPPYLLGRHDGLWGAFSVLFIFMETALGRDATLVLYPPFFWIAAVLMGKRFHDRDKSAWWCLMVAIPVLGPLWLFWQLALRGGSRGDNRFGANPRTADRDYLTLA